ncbi:MAG: phage tail protein [Aeriscardovia sp.]|nr:phage tail protein [Aeriscardovia sp.]MBP3398672.1 phage tail protein [Erysipelotrichaceae bacterium]
MPTSTQNKVKYNLKNVHYAKLISEGVTGPKYGEIKEWPGAVSVNFEPQGESSTFYADGIKYYVTSTNTGYEGDYESALVPEDFKRDILGATEDSDGVLLENADAPTAYFALLFEFDGDVKARRHVMYKCSATRPSVESKTKEENVDVATETVKLTCSTTKINGVNIPKAETGTSTSDEVYNSWYTTIHGAVSNGTGD